jgi:hypothetical protein
MRIRCHDSIRMQAHATILAHRRTSALACRCSRVLAQLQRGDIQARTRDGTSASEHAPPQPRGIRLPHLCSTIVPACGRQAGDRVPHTAPAATVWWPHELPPHLCSATTPYMSMASARWPRERHLARWGRGITLCGGSAWPAGFAHAERAANLQGHQRFMACSCRATAVHEAPLLCASRTAGRAAPCGATAAYGDGRVFSAPGMWHGAVSGGCVRRGGVCPVARPQRVAIRHASRRVACGTVPSQVDARGAVGCVCGATAAYGDTACAGSARHVARCRLRWMRGARWGVLWRNRSV